MGIGWNGKALSEMLQENSDLLAETGCCYGLKTLSLKQGDPLKFERVFSRLRGAIVAARETALHISASPIVRELGELCFVLYSPEGDCIALSTGIIVHVHTMSEAIKWMIRQNYEEDVGIREGDIFINNDALVGDAHTADVQSLIPTFHEGELIAWIGGVNHVMEIGGIDAGGIPITTTNRFGDGLYFTCEKVGENDRLFRTYQIRCERNLRGTVHWNLDEKARLAGCHIMREALKEIIDEFGVDYYKQFIREIIEEGRKLFSGRVKERLFPGRYRAASFYDVPQKGAPLPANAAKDMILHAPVEVTVKPDGMFKLGMNGASKWTYSPANSSLPAMQGGLWVSITQMLAYDGKVNDGAYYATEQEFPYGSWSNPDWPYVSLSATWGPLMVTFNAVYRCMSRSFFSRGYLEEIISGYGHTGLIQWGGTDQYGNPMGGINFELCASGMGARGIMDGLDSGYAMWNPESDMGNMEIWELVFPQIYLGRRIIPGSGGLGKYRGGNGFHSVIMMWGSDDIELTSAGPGKIFDNCGIFGGYPSARVGRRKIYCQDTDLPEIFKDKRPYPSFEGDPKNPEIEKFVEGDFHSDDKSIMFPTSFHNHDVFVTFWHGGPGYGDPIERPIELVEKDLNNGYALQETMGSVLGVVSRQDNETSEWKVDEEKTGALRQQILDQRGQRGVPAKDWWKAERERIMKKELSEPVQRMYRESMSISIPWAEEFRAFWELPDDFEF